MVEEGNAVRPDNPEKDGFVFLTWRDDEGYVYDFEAPVYSNTFLTAEWAALEKVTSEEAELFDEAYIGGETFISFDASPIASVDVQYMLDSIGTVEISEVTDNPMCNTAGLIGSPVEITASGSNVENAEIAFHYDPLKLAVDPNDLSIAWYDSSNDIIVLLSEDTVIDTKNNVAKVLVNYFSIYGLVSKSQWREMWERLLPTSEDIRYNIVLIFDLYADGRISMAYNPITYDEARLLTLDKNDYSLNLAKNLIDVLNNGDIVTSIYVEELRSEVKMYPMEIQSELDKVKIKENMYPSTYYNTNRFSSHIQSMIDGIQSAASIATYNAGLLDKTDFRGLRPYVLANLDNGKYEPVIILFSSFLSIRVIPSDRYSQILNFINSDNTYYGKNIKVILVDIGDNSVGDFFEITDDAGIKMQELANFLGGSYVRGTKPSDLQKKFSDIAANDAEMEAKKTPDTDKDGLPDALETGGMRDQYGKIWSTDFTLVDTDGDGLRDDIEMGKYITDFSPFYFKRFSNPNKTTKIENGSSCTLPSKVNTAIKHRGEKMLYLTVNLKSFGYKDLEEYEAFFQPIKKLEFDITDLPEGFVLKTKNIESSDKKRYIGGYIDKDYTLTAGIAYEDESIELNSIKLKLTIDDMITYSELSIDRTKTYVNSKSLQKAQSAAASVTGAFIGELQNKARSTMESTANNASAVDKLKKQMTPYNIGLINDTATPPDEVYTAFANAVLRAIEDCNIDEYSYKIDKMGVDLMLQVIKQLMGNRTQSYTFNINGVDYKVVFDIHTMSTQGAYTGFGSANISWRDKSLKEHTWLLTWTTNQRENYEALANYCSILDKLADSTMKQFFVTYINTVFDAVGVSKKITVEQLEKAELIIKALCGNKEAGKELSEEVLGTMDDKYHELLKNFIKKNIPGGKALLTAAEKLNEAREKRDDFQNKITEYAALSESEKTASNQFAITEKAYSELKSAYDSLSEIDIFEGFFVPSTDWPSWF